VLYIEVGKTTSGRGEIPIIKGLGCDRGGEAVHCDPQFSGISYVLFF
jgi:hypothetical protein